MDMDQKSTVVEARFLNSRQENFIQSHTRSDSLNSSRYANPRLANTNNSRSANYSHMRSSSRGHTRTPSTSELHRNTSICIDGDSIPQSKENNELFKSTSSFVKTHNRYGTHSTITSLSRKDSGGSYLSNSSERPLLESSIRERARKTIAINTLNSESSQKSSGQQGIPPPSPSSSIRSVNQFTHIHKKRLSRTIQHISSFIQINVNINILPTTSFPVTVEKTFTVERLARQIEAEYAFKFEQVGLCVPLEVGLLYDVGMVALRFQDIVGDVLEHGDVVNVLNIYEGYNPGNLEDVGTSRGDIGWGPELESFISPYFDDDESSPKEQRRFSLPAPTRNQGTISPIKVTDHSDTSALVVPSLPSPALSSPRSPDTISPPQPTTQHIQNIIQASEARFQAVLSNTLALSVFQNFTIREYSTENLLFWLDVELFAAGISSDGEDNYYDEDEQQTALIHAKYIYLTYISQNAPLQVNLSDEIRREIPWPLDDNCQVERNMFDEAQEAVYQLMKGHTFMRFEESNEWKECLRIKTENPEEYEKHEMTESLENYFRPSMSLMMAVTMTLDNEAPPIPISYHYKEQTLYSTLTQYFPKSPQLDSAGKKTENESPSAALHPKTLQGYFNAENRLTTAQRMRRIKKERKLQWVFGEKVVKIAGQFSADPKDQLFDEADDVSSISSILTENRRAAKNVWNRKRKIEKLESIFGRGLKDSQQQLFRRESIFGGGNRDSAISTKTSSADDRCPRTTNELSTKDKRMLWKRNKKLKVILGESLDEELVRQTLTLPIKQTSPTKGRFGISRRASDPMLPITPTSASSFVDSFEAPPNSSNRSISTRRRSGSWDSSKFSINTIPMHVNEDTKEYRRKKLQKLYQFLGERVPVHVALGENSIPSDSLPPVIKNKHRQKPHSLTRKSNKPNSNSNYENSEPIRAIRLSAQDKKRHLHRAVKLEKMFGEVPPQNLIMTSTSPSKKSTWPPSASSMDAHRQNIMSLDYLMENDRETIYELIDYMATSDDDEEEYSSAEDLDTLHRHVSSAPVTPSATQPPSPVSKQARLKGIRKLSHFFGATYGQMFPDQVLGEILVEIEREIRCEASANQSVDRAVVDGLVGKLEELRAKSSELSINTVEKKLHDGTTSEEDAAYTTEEEQYSNVGTSSQTNNYYYNRRRRGSADSDSVLLTVM